MPALQILFATVSGSLLQCGGSVVPEMVVRTSSFHRLVSVLLAACAFGLASCGEAARPGGPDQSVRGTLVDPAGRPLSGVPVFLYRPGSPGEVAARGRTGPDGDFRLPVPVPGADYLFVALPPGCAPLVRRVESAAWRLGRLPVPRGTALAGRVVGDDGLPVAEATVTLAGPGEDPAAEAAIAAALGRPREVRSDGQGSFALGPLAPGTYLLTAAARGTLPGRTRVRVSGEGGTVSVEIRLQRLWTLAGRVTDETGAPVAGALVELAGSGATGKARTDTAGRFRLEGLRRGAYTLRVTAPGHEPAERRAALPAAAPLRLLLRRAPVLAVEAQLAGSGAPPRCFRVRLIPAEAEGPGTLETETRGAALRWDPAPAGRWFVLVTAPGRGFALAGPVRLQPGKTVRLQVVLPREVQLEGHLARTLPQGAPVQGRVGLVAVSVAGRQGGLPPGLRWQAAADGAGFFRFRGLAPGRYRLEAQGRGVVATQTEVELTEGTHLVKLPLEPAGTLAGRIHAAPYRPAARARVTVAGPVRRVVRADAAGRYRCGELPPGVYRVSWEARAVTVRVLGGVTVRADLLARGASRVRGRTEPPAVGLHLVLECEEEAAELGVWHTWTDAEGRFVLDELPPGRYRLGAFTPWGIRCASRQLDLIPGTDLRVALPLPGGRLAGRVRVALTGRPVREGDVWLRPAARVPEPVPPAPLPLAADGRFGARLLPAGEYVLEVVAPGFPVARKTVRVVGTGSPTAVTVSLRGGGILAGTVRRRTATGPCLPAFLALRTPRGETVPGWAGWRPCPTGRFRLEGVPAGRFHLLARRPGYREAVLPVEVTGGYRGDLVLVLSPAE